MHSNPARCGVSGALSDEDTLKLQNLAFTGSIMTWGQQQLSCQLPEGHDTEVHVQCLVAQEFTEPVVWWASWYDVDGLRDQAAMFTGPLCNKKRPGSEAPRGYEEDCQLLDGHTTEADDRHFFL